MDAIINEMFYHYVLHSYLWQMGKPSLLLLVFFFAIVLISYLFFF